MADEFEWQTEVENGWEPAVPDPEKPKHHIDRRSKLVILIVCLCLLSVAAFWVFGSVSGRVKHATTTAESGALLAHKLVVIAVLDGDRDLVESVVADRPASWRALNRDLVAGDLFFSRRPLGIEVAGETTQEASSEFDVRLSPELDAAEIVDRLPYLVMTDPGVTETVVLERTFHYETKDGQWSLAPTDDERQFWGNWIRDERANITLTYPERDEQIAIKLSGYLDSFVPQLCEASGIVCPDAFQLEFKLDIDPTTIRRLEEGLLAIRTGTGTADDRLVLPAPTLVGVPVDEAGFEALKRGYAGWIGAAIVAGYGSADVLPGDVLAQFDLQPPPTPVQALPKQSLSAFPAGAAVPDQDVLMLCSDARAIRLLRFRTSDGRWLEEAPDALWRQSGGQSGQQSPVSSYLSRLPDYKSAVVQIAVGERNESMWRTYLLRDGVARLLIEDKRFHYFVPPKSHAPNQPSAGNLAFFVPVDEEGSQQFTAFLLDLDQCDSSPCDFQELPGMPIWLPGGQRSLLLVPEPDGGYLVHLADKDGRILGQVGRGQSQPWLDDDRFVYIEWDPTSERDALGRSFGQRVMTAAVDDHDPAKISLELLFDAEMVRQAIPASNRPNTLTLWTVQPALNGDTWWFVAGSGDGRSGQQDYVLVYNSLSQETRLVAPLGDTQMVAPPMVNSTGRQAVITGISPGGSYISVELIDAGSGEMRRLADQVPLDWSADGEWLLQSEQGFLYLVPTTVDQQWTVKHDLNGCYWAVWIEKRYDRSDQ